MHSLAACTAASEAAYLASEVSYWFGFRPSFSPPGPAPPHFGPGRPAQPRLVQLPHADPETVARLAEHVLLGHFHAVERELAGRGAFQPELGLDGARGAALRRF